MKPETIVKRANELARAFYRLDGCVVAEGYRFDKARHPRERQMWDMAAIAYEAFKKTDINDALSEVDE